MTRSWAPTPAAQAQFAGAAALAMLVLVVHSTHAHAATNHHDPTVSAAPADFKSGMPSLEAREFLDRAGAIAGCMTLEFSAPRIPAFVLCGTGLLALVTTLVATGQTSATLGAEMARPQTGTRRQSLLGVF